MNCTTNSSTTVKLSNYWSNQQHKKRDDSGKNVPCEKFTEHLPCALWRSACRSRRWLARADRSSPAPLPTTPGCGGRAEPRERRRKAAGFTAAAAAGRPCGRAAAIGEGGDRRRRESARAHSRSRSGRGGEGNGGGARIFQLDGWPFTRFSRFAARWRGSAKYHA